MDEIAYICVDCGKVIFLSSNCKPKHRPKCESCEGNYIKASTRNLPDVTKEMYEQMILNNTWETYLTQNLMILPCVRNLAEAHISSNPHTEFIPKCPTCGCTEIRKISATEKAVNIGIFGLLGNKRTYQFECLNPACKYKW